MELITYKTNVANEASLYKIAPHLNKMVGSSNWQLDLSDIDRVLTVFSPAIIDEVQLLKSIKKAGFKAINLR